MKIISLPIILLLVGCGKSPTEPEILVDVCIDTFSPAGGTTITIRPGDSIPTWPAPPAILLDTINSSAGDR